MEDVDVTLPSLSTRDLAARITELAGHLNAANHRWLVLIAEFDRRQGWSDGFTKSCAHWLHWKCGLDLGGVREKVRVARALEALPAISTAMSTGRLSYSKVRALTRVAIPATESVLLNVALHGTAHHVERLVRQFRRVQEVEGLREERQPSRSARRADALGVLAESFLAHGAEALKGGERHQIVVHVDEATLNQRRSGRCEFEEGPAMPVETARRLVCDAGRVEILEDEAGEPLDVGRKPRTIPPAIKRAMNARDQGCVFPGCTHKRYVDGHHIHHWADGRETRLSNLVSLCRFHHRAVHEIGIGIERCDDGAWRFSRPNGESVDACAPGHTKPMETSWQVVPKENAANGLDIDERTGATRWGGEAMDYGIAIDAFLYRTRKAAEQQHRSE